ncbi:MAG: hypothetical protein JWR16_1417 [Nevskia sp.]|nr:hypothetical protein [Nevskia sp.]
MSVKPSFFAELQRRHVYKVGAMYCVAGWLLVQVVTQVLPIFHIGDVVQQILVLTVIAGFPVALVLAWIFDVTPQGIVRTDAQVPASGAAAATRIGRRPIDRRLNVMLGGLLLIALAYLAAERMAWVPRPAHRTADSNPSIAVLPLVNTGGDPANEYFSDGLSEELIAVLAKIPKLKVVGRSSSFHFKNSSEDSKTIGQKLGVAQLLEGSVLKQGERVRIVAELVEADDGHQLWSETYDRELKDIFAVQTEIAEAVASQLKLRLLGSTERAQAAYKTANLGAYNALLQGDFFRRRFTLEDYRKALDYYNQAIQLDPGYALAYARLSWIWRGMAAIWLDADEVGDGYARARAAAQQALALAPDLAEAHEALGWVLMTPDLDLPAAGVEIRRAVELAPTDSVMQNALSYLLAAEGRLSEADAVTRKAIALDPLVVPPYLNLARILMARGQLDEAAATLQKAIELQPTASHQYAYLVTVDLLRGDSAAALRDAEREPEGFWRNYARALAQQRSGDSAGADQALQRFITSDGVTGAFQVAVVYALRKDPQRMFEWLDKAYAIRDSGLTQLLVTPFLLDYKSDPRFAAVCRQLKLDTPCS